MYFKDKAEALAYYRAEVLPAVHAAQDAGVDGELQYASFAGFAEDCEFGAY